eukprot:925245-Pelagomonas_calceolata.AAC.20
MLLKPGGVACECARWRELAGVCANGRTPRGVGAECNGARRGVAGAAGGVGFWRNGEKTEGVKRKREEGVAAEEGVGWGGAEKTGLVGELEARTVAGEAMGVQGCLCIDFMEGLRVVEQEGTRVRAAGGRGAADRMTSEATSLCSRCKWPCSSRGKWATGVSGKPSMI